MQFHEIKRICEYEKVVYQLAALRMLKSHQSSMHAYIDRKDFELIQRDSTGHCLENQEIHWSNKN